MQKSEKTRKNYYATRNSILRALGNIPIELIGEMQFSLWKQTMELEGKTQTTQRGYVLDFRAIIKYFRRKGLKLMEPEDIIIPSSDTPPRPYLKPEQVIKLINAAKNPRDKAISACLFTTGSRVSELLNLNRSDIDVPIDKRGLQEIYVLGKGEKYRPIFFTEDTRYYLNAYLKTRKDRFVPLFISGQNRRITVSRVEQIIHECTIDAGIDIPVTPHTLRHSFATDLLKNKAPLYEVSKTMGHTNISTTANIYGHHDTEARKNTLSAHQSSILTPANAGTELLR